MHSRLDRVTDWEERAKEARWCVIGLARQLQVTERHLRRYFLARFDLPPHLWLQRIRMQMAAELMVTGQPVKTVAAELGFKQHSHFCRVFQRAHGRVPTAALELKVLPRPQMSDLDNKCPV